MWYAHPSFKTFVQQCFTERQSREFHQNLPKRGNQMEQHNFQKHILKYDKNSNLAL